MILLHVNDLLDGTFLFIFTKSYMLSTSMFVPVSEALEFDVTVTEFSKTKPFFLTSTFLKLDIVLLHNSSNHRNLLRLSTLKSCHIYF